MCLLGPLGILSGVVMVLPDAAYSQKHMVGQVFLYVYSFFAHVGYVHVGVKLNCCTNSQFLT